MQNMSDEKRVSALIQNTAPASNQNTENGNRKSKMKTCTSCGREYAKKASLCPYSGAIKRSRFTGAGCFTSSSCLLLQQL